MNRDDLPVLAIDLGGTKIAAALVSDRRLSGQSRRLPTPVGTQNILEALVDLIEECKREQFIFGVGIATAGMVNPETGEVIGSTGNLPGWEGTPIKKIIQGKLALRVHVENDANAAAYGEFRVLHGREPECLVAVTLGTGIGTGIVIGGKIYRGPHFAGAEAGHMKISMENKRRCTCNLWDCWETYGSGRGLLLTAQELVEKTAAGKSILHESKESMTTEAVIEAARQGDILASRALELYHEHVACGLVSLYHTLDPDLVVITGGMSQFVDFRMLSDMVADRTLPRIAERLDIRPSILREAAGMVGAAELCLDAALSVNA